MFKASDPGQSSVLEYMYRDAGNFKNCGKLLLSGNAGGAEAIILGCLDWGNQFVAEQIGVPSLCRAHWESVGEGPSDLDHAYHEFIRLRPATADELGLPGAGSLQVLLDRTQAAAGRWDATQSPNCAL